MKRTLTTIFFSCFSLALLFISTPVFAADSFGDKPTVTNGTIDVSNGFIPCSGTNCSPCDLVVLFNTLLKWFMTIAFLIFAILAMKAGISLVTSGGNPSALAAAKKSFTNAFIGLIIILAAWLIVDTLLRGVLKGGTGNIEGYGPWSAVQCVEQAVAEDVGTYFAGDPPNWQQGDVMSPGAATAPYKGGPLSQCAPGNGACNLSALQAAGMTQKQAAAMSCIAMTESTGNPSLPPYYKTHPNSSACGTFQVIKSTWESAARNIPGCSNFSQCTNASCNAKVAAKLVQSSGYRSWTCPGCNGKANACVTKYGG